MKIQFFEVLFANKEAKSYSISDKTLENIFNSEVFGDKRKVIVRGENFLFFIEP